MKTTVTITVFLRISMNHAWQKMKLKNTLCPPSSREIFGCISRSAFDYTRTKFVSFAFLSWRNMASPCRSAAREPPQCKHSSSFKQHFHYWLYQMTTGVRQWFAKLTHFSTIPKITLADLHRFATDSLKKIKYN